MEKFRNKLILIFGILLLAGIPVSYFGARAWGVLSEEAKKKEAQRALKESEEKYKALFYYSHDAIMILGPQKHFIAGNPKAIELFACRDEEDFKKKSPIDLSPEYQPDGSLSSAKMKEMMDVAFEKGSIFFEWIHKRTDGTVFPSTVLLSRLHLADGMALQATVRDITEQKQTEAQRMDMERSLMNAQKMESIGVLAGGLAHHINNIAMIIQGNLELALAGINPEDKTVIEHIKSAFNASQKASEITQQMLSFSGKTAIPVLEKIDLNRLVEISANLFRASVPENVALDLNLAGDLPPIEANPSQIRQVIVNLLTSSLEALENRGGSISIATGVAFYDDKQLQQSKNDIKPPAGQFVYIDVADTGCGMSNKTMERLFEPFFSTKFIGRGLGIPAVLGIVQSYKGAIFVDSKLNKGTTVRILLPLS